jgi:hypothetical protein
MQGIAGLITMPNRPSAIRAINLHRALISQLDGSCKKLHDIYYKPVQG